MTITLSPERASVLRRDGRVAFVVEGEPAFEPWRHCTEQCEATGGCMVCERWFPPAGRAVAIEMYGSYCDRECAGWDDDHRQSKHLWPGEFATLERRPPAEWVALDDDCTAEGWCGDGHGSQGCPACHGTGRKVVEAVEPCGRVNCCPGGPAHSQTVASVTVQVLPVVDCVGAFSVRWDSLPAPSVLYHENPYGVGPRLLERGGQPRNIDLDTTPRPGVDWVVVLTMLSDGSPSARSDNAVQGGGAA